MVLKSLDPLEVGHDDATGVGQDVRNNGDPILVQHFVAFGVVGPLAASTITLALTRGALEPVIWFSKSSGDQDVARHLQELIVGDGIPVTIVS